jgi:hypothetical protein
LSRILVAEIIAAYKAGLITHAEARRVLAEMGMKLDARVS